MAHCSTILGQFLVVSSIMRKFDSSLLALQFNE